MEKEVPVQVTTLNEFMEWAAQFNHGAHLFRGVPKAEYEMSASAYRRLKQTEDGDESMDEKFEKFLQINGGLIRDVRLQGHDQKNGRALKDLEILAELQHFRAATCLIDFTYNALVALWFACEQDSENSSQACCACKQESKKPPKDGKVVAVQTDRGGKFRDITLELLEKEIDYFFLGSEDGIPQHLYKWQPPQQNNRIIAQQSIFLFGAVEINPDNECIIDGESKEQLRESLKQGYGITEAMLFPDFEGFARQHRQDIPYTQLAASQYRKRARQKWDRHEYEETIADYTEAIKVAPGESSDYFNRGHTKEMLLKESGRTDVNEYKAVIADYTEVINLDPNYPFAYYQRGILRRDIGNRYEAVQDLEKALQLARQTQSESFVALINQNLEDIRQVLRNSNTRN